MATNIAKHNKNGSSNLQNQFFICNTFLPSIQYLHQFYPQETPALAPTIGGYNIPAVPSQSTVDKGRVITKKESLRRMTLYN